MIYRMRVWLFFPIFIAAIESGFGQAAAALSCFEHFRQEGEAAVNRRRPNFELARKKFSAAKECPEATAEMRRQMEERIRDVEARNLDALEKQIDRAEASQALAEARAIEADSLRDEAKQALSDTKKALDEAEKRRLESEAATRHALANDLAFRAQTALRDGDRTTALRLAEFAWRFVEHGNLRAQQAILDVFYQNDKTSDRCPLPWRTHSFGLAEGDLADVVRFSNDGKFLAASTTLGAAYVWELASGRELFFLPTQAASGAVAFSSDLKKVAVGHGGEEVLLYEVASGRPPLSMPCPESDNLSTLIFSPDNSQISAVTGSGAMYVFNTKTGKALAKMGIEGGKLLATAVSPDQKTLLLINDDGRIEVVDIERGERRAAFALGSPYPLATAFSPDGKWVAIACADRSMGIWRAADGVKVLAFAPQTLAATSIYFSADGKTLTSLYANNDAKNWDTATGIEQKIDRDNIGETYYDLQISPDGRLKTVISYDRGLEVFDNHSGKKLYSRPVLKDVVRYGFSPDSRFMLLGHLDGSAELMDSEKGTLRFTIPTGDEVTGHFFSPDSRQLAFARSQGSIDVWELGTEPRLFPKENERLAGEAIFSPDGRLVAIPLVNDSLEILDAKTGQRRFKWGGRGPSLLFIDGERLLSWDGEDRSTAIISDLKTGKIAAKCRLAGGEGGSYFFQAIDGGKLLTGSAPGSQLTEVFDARTGERLPFGNNLMFIHASADGRFFAKQFNDSTALQVTDRATGRAVFTYPTQGNFVGFGGFSPDGKKVLLTDFANNCGLVYEILSGKLLHKLVDSSLSLNRLAWGAEGRKINTADPYFSQWDAETGALEVSTYLSSSRFSFSNNGNRAVSTLQPREATIWDVANARPQFTLRGHTKDITDLGFSADGEKVLTASADQTARLWDAGTGREILRLEADTFEMTRAALSPDGRMASIWQNGRTVVWHLDADTLLDILEKTGRFAPLSPEQIYDFNIEEPLRATDIFELVLLRWPAAECRELARFYLQQGVLQYDIGRFQTSFRRAEQLFQKASNEADQPSISLELAELYTQWSKKLLQNGLSAEAKKLAARVEKLTALSTSLDKKSKLQLAFAQRAAGNEKAADDIYQQFLDKKEDLQEVKAAVEESNRIFGKGKEPQPIYAQINQAIAADTVGKNGWQTDGPIEQQPDDPAEVKDWPAKIAETRGLLKITLQRHLNYTDDGTTQAITDMMGNLSFYLLFDRKFDEARRFAELGLQVDSAQTFIHTNLAHAHLFMGHTEKAREIYQKLSTTPDPGDPSKTFRETLMGDFELFAKVGLRSRELPKMVELVSGQKLTREERNRYLPE